nr:DNA polymerase III subunit delta' [Azohydromonas sediminis]
MSAAPPLLPWLAAPLERAAALRAHALLIHGPEGVGQFELALALAQHGLCEAESGPRPCGQCAGCRLLASRAHPDLRVLVPAALRDALGAAAAAGDDEADDGAVKATKAKPSRDIRVDEVRQAIDWTRTTATRGRGKVLVLHPAQAMNAVAANALLKTLEEPPAGVRLLLTCADPDALLPTIRSRCQRVALALPARDAALAWLQSQGVAGADVLLAAAGGRPQEVLALRADGFDAERWQRVPGAVAHGDAGVFAGCSVERVVDVLHKLAHDLLVVGAGAAPHFFPADSLPGGASMPALTAWTKTLQRVARHAEHPWHAPLLIESLVAQGRGCFTTSAPRGRAGTATLAAR